MSAVQQAAVFTFLPNYRVVGEFNGLASIAALDAERGMYSASAEFVRRHGGPIAVGLLDAVPAWYYAEAESLGLQVNCDVRIHRLYPGDFPAYPGWHCDGEYRETYFSQPDLARVRVHHHLVATVSTHHQGVSNTQFLAQPFEAAVDSDAADVTLWGQVHRQVEAAQRRTWDSRDGQLVAFDSWALHRAMPARIRGWRLFFRMSMWHKPNLGDGGKFSKQEQVYKLIEGSGW